MSRPASPSDGPAGGGAATGDARLPRALELEDVRFRYRGADRLALDGVSLAIEAGKSAWLLGESGSGRSTLAMVPGRIVPHHVPGDFSGRVSLFGRSVDRVPPADLAGTIGQVFQDFESQIFGTRVDLETAFGCENLGVPPAEMRRRVPEALERVGLAGFEQRDPTTLSGGEKQRLVIAAILAMQPRLVVLDEPTTDLDPVGRGAVWRILRDLERDGVSLLLVEPETDEADLADAVVVLRSGRIVAQGPAPEVLAGAERLGELGVRPPDLCALACRLGMQGGLRDVEQGRKAILEAGWRLDSGRVDELTRPEAGARPGMDVLRARGLRHSYTEAREALAGVDAAFGEGEFTAILGANGSGKTTLAQILCGMRSPSKGEVLLRGRPVSSIPAAERGRAVGFVFQNPDHQIFAPSVGEEVAFAARNFGLDGGALARAVGDALATVGLEGREQADPFVLTRGDRQRVAVASILAAGPGILVLDEPTTGLDHRDQDRMMALLRRLARSGRTVIAVTHAVGLAARWADRIVVMQDGRIVEDGPPRSVMSSGSLAGRSAIVPPRIVRLACGLGAPLLSVEELAGALVRRDAWGQGEA